MSLVVSSTVTALHLVSTGTAKMERRTVRNSELSLVLHRLRGELRLALTVIELTADTVTITHPDITGDDVDDVIRYT